MTATKRLFTVYYTSDRSFKINKKRSKRRNDSLSSWCGPHHMVVVFHGLSCELKLKSSRSSQIAGLISAEVDVVIIQINPRNSLYLFVKQLHFHFNHSTEFKISLFPSILIRRPTQFFFCLRHHLYPYGVIYVALKIPRSTSSSYLLSK